MNQHSTRQAGFVLVSVLWILAILTVVALSFGRRSMMERKVAWYAMDHAQALQMARGACERGVFELMAKPQVDVALEKMGYTGLDQRWAKEVDLFKEGDYFRAEDDAQFKDEQCRYRVWDCESRISINDAPEEILHELDGLTATHVRKLMARRRSEGEEMEGFSTRFLSPEELRSFLEIDDEDWYGQRPGEGLKDMLTAWGDDNGKVNLNTASRRILEAIPDIDRGIVDGILEYRMGPDGKTSTEDDLAFHSMAELATVLEVSAEKLSAVNRFCKIQSRFFTIEAYATRRQGKVVARCAAVVYQGGTRRVVQWSEDTVGT